MQTTILSHTHSFMQNWNNYCTWNIMKQSNKQNVSILQTTSAYWKKYISSQQPFKKTHQAGPKGCSRVAPSAMGVGASAKGKEVTSKADSADSAKSSAAPSVPPAAKSEEVAEMGNFLGRVGRSYWKNASDSLVLPHVVAIINMMLSWLIYMFLVDQPKLVGQKTSFLVGIGIFAIQGATVWPDVWCCIWETADTCKAPQMFVCMVCHGFDWAYFRHISK